MGWRIKQNKTKTKYKVYSTVVDDYITEWLDKAGIIRFFFYEKFERLMEDMVKEMNNFPDRWTDVDTDKRIINDENNNKAWEIISNQDKMYEFFLKELGNVGINLTIKDVDGVDFSTDEFKNK